jgi:hypothetical protein
MAPTLETHSLCESLCLSRQDFGSAAVLAVKRGETAPSVIDEFPKNHSGQMQSQEMTSETHPVCIKCIHLG